MSRNLLADRFGLTAHFAKKEVRDYELIVAKGGPTFMDHEWRDPVPGTVSFSFKLVIDHMIHRANRDWFGLTPAASTRF
jgi:uncharacterized protein (TIGR03435 family)